MNNDELKQAFILSEHPAGHYDAYKAGASQGYLMAKRQMVEAIDNSIDMIKSPFIRAAMRLPDIESAKVAELEQLRSFIRNIMLWRKP